MQSRHTCQLIFTWSLIIQNMLMWTDLYFPEYIKLSIIRNWVFSKKHVWWFIIMTYHIRRIIEVNESVMCRIVEINYSLVKVKFGWQGTDHLTLTVAHKENLCCISNNLGRKISNYRIEIFKMQIGRLKYCGIKWMFVCFLVPFTWMGMHNFV